jgi:flagellar protein FlaG
VTIPISGINGQNNFSSNSQSAAADPTSGPAVAPRPDNGSGPSGASVEPSDAQMQAIIHKANEALAKNNIAMQFSVDESTGIRVVQVVDTQSGQVIRQFPSKELLSVAGELDSIQQGLLINQKA